MLKRPDWYPDWSGETIIIVASGPSAVDAPLDIAIGKARFVAINNSWRLCPWADALVAVDYQWWDAHKGCREFRGPLRIAVDGRVKNYPEWGVRYLPCNKGDDRIVLDKVGVVGWGGNSGFVALNWAAQLQPSKIVLVGYDMTKAYGGHWHEAHPLGLTNPTLVNVDRWRRAVDAPAPYLAAAGITVVNCSSVSKLGAYPKMCLEDALAYRIGDNVVPLTKPPAPLASPVPSAELQLLDPLDGCRSMLELGNKKNKAGSYKAYFEKLGIEHISVDLNGGDGAMPLDLQKPLGLGRRFDVVTNFGTSEHVANQEPCWRNIIEHAGRSIISTTPIPGDWSWHGRWYPRPEFFAALAATNGFKVERFYVAGVAPRRMFFARMKRIHDVSFEMPPPALFYENKAGRKVGRYGG